jgi:hypothetical protein
MKKLQMNSRKEQQHLRRNSGIALADTVVATKSRKLKMNILNLSPGENSRRHEMKYLQKIPPTIQSHSPNFWERVRNKKNNCLLTDPTLQRNAIFGEHREAPRNVASRLRSWRRFIWVWDSWRGLPLWELDLRRQLCLMGGPRYFPHMNKYLVTECEGIMGGMVTGVRVFGDLRQGWLDGRAVVVSFHPPHVSSWLVRTRAFGPFGF